MNCGSYGPVKTAENKIRSEPLISRRTDKLLNTGVGDQLIQGGHGEYLAIQPEQHLPHIFSSFLSVHQRLFEKASSVWIPLESPKR